MGSGWRGFDSPLRSLQEILAVPPALSPQAIFCDGDNGKSERLVLFPSPIYWLINRFDRLPTWSENIRGRVGVHMERL